MASCDGRWHMLGPQCGFNWRTCSFTCRVNSFILFFRVFLYPPQLHQLTHRHLCPSRNLVCMQKYFIHPPRLHETQDVMLSAACIQRVLFCIFASLNHYQLHLPLLSCPRYLIKAIAKLNFTASSQQACSCILLTGRILRLLVTPNRV